MTRPTPPASMFVAALALAMGAAVSLGLARFSYALLLPPMRADLGWNYFTAGAMNTANAAGYLAGALLVPSWLARHDARAVLLRGMVAVTVLMAAHALFTDDAALYAMRFVTGLASAVVFVSGGVLAARLGSAVSTGTGSAAAARVIGLYYGGTGVGIVASALLVPPLVAWPSPIAPGLAGWRWAWIGMAVAALLATAFTRAATRAQATAATATRTPGTFEWRRFGFALAAYLMFGLGYIGYMTFVITLLREQRLPQAQIVGFYVLLGVGVVASSWIWSGLLQRHRGGRPLAWLNALLALATVLPVVSAHPLSVFASGALFGAVFLSVVASTTALVRHNLPAQAWPGGIAAFTIVFAAGQIAGPVAIGWIADGPGGLARGFVVSAALLTLASLLALWQKPPPQG